MNKKQIGFEIKIKEGAKIVSTPMAEDLVKHFKKQKNHSDYIKEFLISKKNFDKANEAMKKAMTDSLPIDIEENCDYCKGESEDESDKKCTKYYIQMQLTYSIAANEFIAIVLKNKHIYENKDYLPELTNNFFSCLNFVNGKGIMLFDLDKIVRHTLNAGFLSISQNFSKSETLKNLKIINHTLDNLEQKELKNKVLEKESDDYIELQKEFFEKKQRFYKEKLFIENKGGYKKEKAPKKKNTPTVPQYALYFYYLQKSSDYPYFENHPIGKLEAIKELIHNEKVNTTSKYFQIKYNFISVYDTNRIARNQMKNIDFVANTMLKGFPKAKELALSELKIALTKNK